MKKLNLTINCIMLNLRDPEVARAHDCTRSFFTRIAVYYIFNRKSTVLIIEETHAFGGVI